jgi:MYXO-CTERM domain-containing protein
MPAVVRYTWMFRTAAAVFLLLGAAWLWTFAFTDYHPEQRPYGLAAALAALALAYFLFHRRRFAVGISAVVATIVCLSATVFAPNAQGPAILFLAGLAFVCGVYAVFAARVLFERSA